MVDDLSSRMVMVETQMKGFDHRMAGVENKLDGVLSEIKQFMIMSSTNASKPVFDPQKVMQFLLTGAALLGIIASSIVYIAKSQSAERISTIEVQLVEQARTVSMLEKAYVEGLKEELGDLRRRVGWRAETLAVR